MLPSLSYGVSRIQGVSSNHFMLEPNNSSTATPNSITRFSLPENALWNTRATTLHFNATTSGSGARLPPKIDSLVQSYRVSAGGVQLSSGHNLYNVLRHAKDAICGNKCDTVLGHPEMVRTKTYVDDTAAITGINAEVYADDGVRRFAISHWEGFLGSISPSVLDTSLFPSLTLEIVWAPVSVLSSVAGVKLSGTAGDLNFDKNGDKGCSYTCRDLLLSINVVGLASNMYDEMVSSRMQSTGYLELPFTNYFLTENTHATSTRFSVASQSLDRIIVVQREKGFDDQTAPVIVEGHVVSGAFCHATAVSGFATPGVDVGVPTFDNGGILDTRKEKYITRFFNFSEKAGSSGAAPKYSFMLQGTQVPQVEASAEVMYAITRDAFDLHHTEQSMTLSQYKKNYMVQAIRLCLPDSHTFRTISGLDTRGISLDGFYKASIDSDTNVCLYCECTSTIRVGAARSIEVVV